MKTATFGGATTLLAVLLLGGCAGTAGGPAETAWATTCAGTLEDRGGRGANVADALCTCMDEAADEYDADRDALMTVAGDEAAFSQLGRVERRIVLACLQRTRG